MVIETGLENTCDKRITKKKKKTKWNEKETMKNVSSFKPVFQITEKISYWNKHNLSSPKIFSDIIISARYKNNNK